VHRSQVLQASGDWVQALAEASSAEARLARALHPAAGVACYQQGELHRLRGDFEAAERAYRQASQHGREPTPGLALLRLAEGRLAAATDTVRRMLDEAREAPGRLAVLPAYVEIALAAGDLAAARAASNELSEMAAATGSPFVDGLAAHALGSVLLADGDASGAVAALRQACRAWRELGMPYECGRSQELVGVAYRALGDRDAADVELDASRAVFQRLGAAADVARVTEQRLASTPAPDTGTPHPPLTERECEVLRLVAAGDTNRAIGAELTISEHTVARHVQNIFTKLGVSSRAAATAYAYENDIV
jgi:ATP/maltotriose-dependent transcriptional regulator MalT